MGKYFGTDGIRGTVNTGITSELALSAGKAAACVLQKKFNRKIKFIIGRDTRISGTMLESALSAGITSAGADVYTAGVIPTPAIAYLVRKLDFDCGIVISASHNPAADNGIKFFANTGFKLSDEEEAEIENIIDNGLPEDFQLPSGRETGRVYELHSSGRIYANYVESLIKECFCGQKIVLDCANGAASEVAPEIFSHLGASATVINGHPNGTNINEKCGSTYPEFLCEVVKAGGFSAGFAFDGDADRLISVDENGEIVDGDEMMNIFGRYYKEKNMLASNTVVATVMSNIGFEKSLAEAGIKLERSDVGDRNVLFLMQKNGAIIGGEQSGHIIFLKDNTTGDGIITAVKLLSIIKETGKSLSELKSTMKKYPQVLVNVNVADKKEIMNNPDFKTYLNSIIEEKKASYRILVRPSGTEQKIRVMAEGPDEASTKALVDEICEKVREFDKAVCVK